MKTLLCALSNAILLAVLPAGQADAEDTATLRIENNTMYTFYMVYISPSKYDVWGPDILEDDVIESGNEMTIGDIPCDQYDIRIIDEDGDDCTLSNVHMCGWNSLEFSNEVWLGCIIE